MNGHKDAPTADTVTHSRLSAISSNAMLSHRTRVTRQESQCSERLRLHRCASDPNVHGYTVLLNTHLKGVQIMKDDAC
jgi:hypothetical protein